MRDKTKKKDEQTENDIRDDKDCMQEKEERNNKDWEWGCCNDSDACDELIEGDSVCCSMNDCNLWYHIYCLKSNYDYCNKEIKRIQIPHETFKCPECDKYCEISVYV